MIDLLAIRAGDIVKFGSGRTFKVVWCQEKQIILKLDTGKRKRYPWSVFRDMCQLNRNDWTIPDHWKMKETEP